MLVSTLSYKVLDVQRGDQAQQVWETAIALPESDQKQELMQALRAYCHLDTLAMLEIFKVLINNLAKQ